MSDNLRDQLLKAGVVSKKKATQVERQEHRKQHLQKKGQKPAGTDAQQRAAAARAQAAKVERDRELNRQRQAEAEAKARTAAITQLIEQHQLPLPEGDDYFNFTAEGKVRRIAVNAALRSRLGRGEVVIVRHAGRTALVPADVAARIRDLDPGAPVAYGPVGDSTDENDAYKDFVVPDDLRW